MSDDRIWVFAGPSLPTALRPRGDVFHWRPPAIAGDAVLAAEVRPRAVVLIDGLFDAYPAIRHKELLDLLAQGVPVIGAASMGALRAAELHRFGMRGAGAVFRAYATGRITADDEVAVLHGPAGMDWTPLTIAQVNVRASLAEAARRGVIDVDTARALRAGSHRIFFQDRTWRTLREIAAAERVAPADQLGRFALWIEAGGAVDIKQRDALQALAEALEIRADGHAPAHPPSQTAFAAALARQVSEGLKPDPASA